MTDRDALPAPPGLPALAHDSGFDSIPVLFGSLTLCRGCWCAVPRWAQSQHAARHKRMGDPWPPLPPSALPAGTGYQE